MDQQNEGKVVVGGIDVRADGYVLAIYEAERLEAQAKALYAKAETLRGQRRVTVLISSDLGGPGGYGFLARLDGRVVSTGPAQSAEEACQIAYHFIQGYQPPLRLPPFGARVDQTLPGIVEGFEEIVGNEQSAAPRN
ncbi:hypothetical protein RG836_00290 [Pseudomonas sp. SZMC_28357]|uniref:hypothetical protein n=1 Tax=Pseudomonas sp. SZMC_28357 TaxID=3074380 RepID=UPI0028723211|nr:hypothetical protein [Pseudomonas sp. SZMC_28357]MDR9749871.1 hypothetical protein [Pseudomonas sp. SZMC_28357]